MKSSWNRARAFGPANAALLLATLGLAYAIKRFYSLASVEALDFILRPSAWFSGLLLGTPFVFRPGEGYLGRDVSILITAGCAGVNFWIIAFVTLVGAFALRPKSLVAKAAAGVSALAFAFVVTVLVNALRIALSVWLAPYASLYFELSFQAAHRYIGVVLYLGALFTLVLGLEAALRAAQRAAPSPTRASSLLAFSLVTYLAVTLLVPWLRAPHAAVSTPFDASGAASRLHSRSVAVLALTLTALVWLACAALGALTRRLERMRRHPPGRAA